MLKYESQIFNIHLLFANFPSDHDEHSNFLLEKQNARSLHALRMVPKAK